MQPTGVHGSGAGWPSTSQPRLVGCSPSTSLAGSTADRMAFSSRPVGCWTMKPVQSGSSLSSCTTASTSSSEVPAGRSRRMLRMPISAQSRCLAPTYQWLPGSSPTSTVPRPGTTPCSASAATRWRSSSLIVPRIALPSNVVAVTRPILSRRGRGALPRTGRPGIRLDGVAGCRARLGAERSERRLRPAGPAAAPAAGTRPRPPGRRSPTRGRRRRCSVRPRVHCPSDSPGTLTQRNASASGSPVVGRGADAEAAVGRVAPVLRVGVEAGRRRPRALPVAAGVDDEVRQVGRARRWVRRVGDVLEVPLVGRRRVVVAAGGVVLAAAVLEVPEPPPALGRVGAEPQALRDPVAVLQRVRRSCGSSRR